MASFIRAGAYSRHDYIGDALIELQAVYVTGLHMPVPSAV